MLNGAPLQPPEKPILELAEVRAVDVITVRLVNVSPQLDHPPRQLGDPGRDSLLKLDEGEHVHQRCLVGIVGAEADVGVQVPGVVPLQQSDQMLWRQAGS